MMFTFRPYQDSDFNEALVAIHAASRADGVPYLPSEADFRSRLATPAGPDLGMAGDAWVAEVGGEGVVAYADGHLTCQAGERLYRAAGFVAPPCRGLGRALLARQWARVKELAHWLGGPAAIRLGVRAFETQPRAIRLFQSFGLRRQRDFFIMHRDLSMAIPPLQVPDGLQMPAYAGRHDDRAVWAAMVEAFKDHWGSTAESFDVFEHRVQAGWFQPESSFVVWEGDQVAGASLNAMGPGQAARVGRNQGWIGMVFVRRPWRQRGLGRALLVASLLRARALGHELAGLNVDAENLSGAVRLYEAVGFYRAMTRIVYHRRYPEDEEEAR